MFTEIDPLVVNGVEITLFKGTGHDFSIYIIGRTNISGNHYEFRVIGNSDKVDGKYVNYIYNMESENFTNAKLVMANLVEKLK